MFCREVPLKWNLSLKGFQKQSKSDAVEYMKTLGQPCKKKKNMRKLCLVIIEEIK